MVNPNQQDNSVIVIVTKNDGNELCRWRMFDPNHTEQSPENLSASITDVLLNTFDIIEE